MSIADHPLISRRYFFPRRTTLPAATTVQVEGARLACVHANFGHELTVVHFHGNGEIVSDWLDLAPLFDEFGVNVFFAEYRGYGASTGEPMLAAQLDDVSSILRAAGELSRLIVFGRSIGSIYAIEAVARHPEIAGLILESGIADVRERILLRVSPAEMGVSPQEFDAEMSRLFDHESKLSGYAGPTLVLHAEHDHLVDISHAERNARWTSGPADFFRFPAGDHNSIFSANQMAYISAVRTFLSALTTG